jgi:parallel beta-helix repeat protein
VATWRCAAAAICLLAGAATRVSASDDLCGATIVESLKLDHDVVCSGDGLIVGADGIRIDLDGHAISGAGSGVGIIVSGRRDVSITAGTIGNFATGIRIVASTDIEIKYIEFNANPEGIDFQAGSVGNTVKDSLFRNSTIRGIMLRTNVTGNDVKNNRFINDRVGILIFGGVDNTLKQNEISGSSVAAIRINQPADGNVLKDNLVSSSLAGIEFLVTAAGWAQENELKDNTISSNGCGLKGPTDGNTLKDNSFQGNTLDSCS